MIIICCPEEIWPIMIGEKITLIDINDQFFRDRTNFFGNPRQEFINFTRIIFDDKKTGENEIQNKNKRRKVL